MRVQAVDGWTLGVQRVGTGDTVVLALHAMMVDGRSLDRPAGAGVVSQLAAAGHEVWVADLRGRGTSGPTPAEGGVWRYDDLALRDLPALVGAARASGRRVAVVGHSLGGHVSVAAAAAGLELDALVLVAANMWLPSLERDRAARAAKALAMRAFGRIGRHLGRFPSRALGAGPADEAGPYVADLRRAWQTDRWTSADGRIDYLASARAITAPTLSVLGAGDALLGRPDAAAAWASHIGPRGAEVWLVGEGRHGVAGRPGHMGLVTDARHQGWVPPMIRWLDGALGRTPAGRSPATC